MDYNYWLPALWDFSRRWLIKSMTRPFLSRSLPYTSIFGWIESSKSNFTVMKKVTVCDFYLIRHFTDSGTKCPRVLCLQLWKTVALNRGWWFVQNGITLKYHWDISVANRYPVWNNHSVLFGEIDEKYSLSLKPYLVIQLNHFLTGTKCPRVFVLQLWNKVALN